MNFNNSQTAFEYKSLKQLKNSLRVYKIITRPILVKLGKILLQIALFFRIPLKPFTGFMFKQFCGGENLSEVIKLAENLNKYGVKTIPDYSIEGVADEKSFDKLSEELKKTIDIAAINKNIPFAVFKPTGLIKAEYLTEKHQKNSAEISNYIMRLDKIFLYAYERNISVMVDAEDYIYQNRVDEILLDFMKKYNQQKAIVFTTLQMYRQDRLEYLQDLIDEARTTGFKLGIKFVRGAYMEKERQRAKDGNYPDPINKTKEITDNYFDKAIELSIANIDIVDIFCGTHNEKSVQKLIDLMKLNNIPADYKGIYFSQLYGMRDNISFALSKESYNVAKYLPYGPIKEVMPYLVRRAEENSSMGSQAKMEIQMIKEVIRNRQK